MQSQVHWVWVLVGIIVTSCSSPQGAETLIPPETEINTATISPTSTSIPTDTPTPTLTPTSTLTPTWTPIPTTENSLRSLAAANNIYIGAAVQSHLIKQDSLYQETLGSEFNMLTPEWEMKFDPIQHWQGVFNFRTVDEIVMFAEANNMLVRGHTLVWHQQVPSWFENGDFTRDECINILEEHITTVASHYRGRIYAWDVVNEGIDDNGQLRDTIWLDCIGPEYMEMAFQWAHAADPDALLFYNDYGIDGVNYKSNQAYALVQDLLAKDIPIHGVGLQMHLGLDRAPTSQSVASNIERFGELGLEVHITEMDVSVTDSSGTFENRLERQANIYRDMFEVCLNAEPCTSFVLWGFTDKHTWLHDFRDPDEQPLLLDELYQPKPAYEALVELMTDF